MYQAVVKHVKLIEKDSMFHIGINNGRISTITTEDIRGEIEWEANGGIALPPFVEMHTHLDTVLTAGKSLKNRSGTLMEGIERWKARKARLTCEDVMERAEKAIYLLIQHGVLYVRAAVDISDPELTALKAIVKLRDKLQHFIDIQIIAFPQDGIISCEENKERLVKAIELGADAVSAVPHLEHTRENGILSLKECFSIAKESNSFVHIFSDEIDDEQSRYLEVIADLTLSQRMEGKVTVSHANALAYYADSYAAKVIALVKQAKLSVVSCPLINCTMQGRFDHYPIGRGITRIKELNASKVNVCIAHDDIQTPFYPFGNGNILQAAHMGAHLSHMTGEHEIAQIIQMITYNGAKAFGIHEEYGIEVGYKANFIVLPVDNIVDMVSKQPACRFVFKEGKLVVENKPTEPIWYSDLLKPAR
ncbi:amidohydrolase family protein [Bacillus sp. SA1-12]|uniref:amidohydrolase family protein n=1 Tax=Bacillus sp. SA1-12 TaxID=1455638 RepID=UPI000698C264|nr:amidohydrolase family protein [Bacillus sp. SA1-12]